MFHIPHHVPQWCLIDTTSAQQIKICNIAEASIFKATKNSLKMYKWIKTNFTASKNYANIPWNHGKNRSKSFQITYTIKLHHIFFNYIIIKLVLSIQYASCMWLLCTISTSDRFFFWFFVLQILFSNQTCFHFNPIIFKKQNWLVSNKLVLPKHNIFTEHIAGDSTL